MREQPVIALDAMGGDNGPSVVVPGAAESLVRDPRLKFILFGDEAIVSKWLSRYPSVAEASEFVQCDVAVRMDEKPSQALRRGRRVGRLEERREGAGDFVWAWAGVGGLRAGRGAGD